MYVISKVINNNVVCSIEKDGTEVIVRGLGVGFQKKTGDLIQKEKVEKIYRIANEKTSNSLQQLLEDIPLEHVQMGTEIIDYVREKLNRRLNDNIFITLIDHINFAIERKENHLEYKNALLWEIKKFYPSEYQMGLKAIDMIEERLQVRLSEDEAGFIALHFVNAELDTDMSSTYQITELIHDVLEIVKNYYDTTFDEESIHYERFITHLKFFGQRLFTNRVTQDNDAGFYQMIKNRYQKDYACAMLIESYVEERYKQKITEEEKTFLTVHLRRITMDKNER